MNCTQSRAAAPSRLALCGKRVPRPMRAHGRRSRLRLTEVRGRSLCRGSGRWGEAVRRAKTHARGIGCGATVLVPRIGYTPVPPGHYIIGSRDHKALAGIFHNPYSVATQSAGPTGSQERKARGSVRSHSQACGSPRARLARLTPAIRGEPYTHDFLWGCGEPRTDDTRHVPPVIAPFIQREK